MKKRPPLWITVEDILGFHSLALSQAGGSEGLRDRGLLEAAVSRPMHRWQYEEADLFDLVAAYAYGVANNHPFLDGNKRAAFLAAFAFLVDNGVEPPQNPADATIMTLGLADKSVSESKYAAWLRENSKFV